MAFDKRTWQKQSRILDRLNHIEDYLASDDGGSGGGDDGGSGGGGGVLIISFAAIDENTYRMDKTVGEIWDAVNSGKTLWISTNSFPPATELVAVDQLVYGEYEGAWFFGTWNFEATADSEANLRLQYPESSEGGPT